jgi:hypothetical protein
MRAEVRPGPDGKWWFEFEVEGMSGMILFQDERGARLFARFYGGRQLDLDFAVARLAE